MARNWVMLFSMLLFSVTLFAEVPNKITYTGRLRSYGQPVNGEHTLKFNICFKGNNGDQVYPLNEIVVNVSSGLFSCELSLDPAKVDYWRGQDYELETMVDGKLLAPREKLTSQVFALRSHSAECVLQSEGQPIDFVIGNSTRATISSSGMKSLANGTTYYMVPKGAIIMWAGSTTDLPYGWAICDGTRGTPNLSGRFIVAAGAGSGYVVGDRGGYDTIDISHIHPVSISADTGQGNYQGVSAGAGSEYTNRQNHSHHIQYDGTTGTGGATKADNRPKFYALAYIMRISEEE